MATLLDTTWTNVIILICTIIGLLYGIIMTVLLKNSKVSDNKNNYYKDFSKVDPNVDQRISLMIEVAGHVERGAKAFLYAEY